MKEINEAFHTLSDPSEKKIYDEEYRNTFQDYSDDVNRKHQNNNKNTSDKKTDKKRSNYRNTKWNKVCDTAPDVKVIYDEFYNLNPNLGHMFKEEILQQDSYLNVKSVANEIENKYFLIYFGENEDIQKIAKDMLLSKQKEVAAFINKAIKERKVVYPNELLELLVKKFGSSVLDHTDVDLLKFFMYALRNKGWDWTYDIKSKFLSSTKLNWKIKKGTTVFMGNGNLLDEKREFILNARKALGYKLP